jgi:hypothetical protein
MGKRRTPSGELKSVAIPAQVHKYRDMQRVRDTASAHWNVDHVQPFFPSLEVLFKTENLDNVKDHGLKLNEQVESVVSKDKVLTSSGEKEVHIKQAVIVNSLKWMRGDYGTSMGLSTTKDEAISLMEKVQSPNNSAYVGSLFSAILSQTGCIHFPKVYGVFSGIAKKHTFDISDDYEELSTRPWFSKNIGTYFQLQLADHVSQTSEFKHTRTNRIGMDIGDAVGELGHVEEVDGIAPSGDVTIPEMNRVFSEDLAESDDESDSSSVSTSYVFEVRSCDCSDDEEIDDDEDFEDEDGFASATLSNVPVQLTVMEKCEGTLYELMTLEPETEKHVCWLTQVLAALAFAQKTIGLTHNDLHSNNIMYVKTDRSHLWYKVDGRTMKVPTHGYLIKIIDFERGVGSIKLVGMKQPKIFMSDHFAMDEEASGQYNVEPFYSQRHETIKPNPSFDCVRLATSMFWDLFPQGPDHKEYESNPIFKTIIRWMSLEDGTSILFGKTQPEHERYHGFHLYKAIARFCKDTAIPRKELIGLIEVFGTKETHTSELDMVLM